MTTVLFYLVVAAVIGLVVFFLAVFVFGRGEQMAPLDPRTSPAELPEADITAEDVRKIRFALALRGYRMSDVDWTLERLGEQIDQLRRDNAQLRGEPLLVEEAPERPAAEVDQVGILASEPDEESESDAWVKMPVTVGAHATDGDINSTGRERSTVDHPFAAIDDGGPDPSPGAPAGGSSAWDPTADGNR